MGKCKKNFHVDESAGSLLITKGKRNPQNSQASSQPLLSNESGCSEALEKGGMMGGDGKRDKKEIQKDQRKETKKEANILMVFTMRLFYLIYIISKSTCDDEVNR